MVKELADKVESLDAIGNARAKGGKKGNREHAGVENHQHLGANGAKYC